MRLDDKVKSAKPFLAIIIAILVVIPTPGCGGGGSSGPAPNPNPNPTPTPVLNSIVPSSAAAGSAAFQLTVNGSTFNTSSVVMWNGSARTTTFVSAGEVRAAITTTDVAVAGTATVTVSNGTLVSNGLAFTITGQGAAGQVLLISIATDGGPANGDSFSTPSITPDGRYVAFQSNATNLVSGSSTGFSDIFVRDTCLGAPAGCTPTTVRVSVSTAGVLADGNSRRPSISATGRFVAFDSSATNLVPGDTNGTQGALTGLADVFVRDTCIGIPSGCSPSTIRASVATDNSESNGDSRRPSISADGRFVAFNSGATNLDSNDSNGFGDIFLRDTCQGAPAGCAPSTRRISLANDGSQGNGASGLQAASPDMRFVAFLSTASNFVSGDTNLNSDYFVRDTCLGAAAGCVASTIRASIATDGAQANDLGDLEPSISSEGRFVAFTSHATNLVPADTNARADVFVRDTCTGVTGCTPSTFRASVSADGSQANSGSEAPSMSSTGRLVAFSSLATNLIPAGTSSPKTIFIRDTCQGAPAGCMPTTILIGRSASGSQDNGVSEFPALSADGRWVAFLSSSTNLAPGATNGRTHTLLAKTGF